MNRPSYKVLVVDDVEDMVAFIIEDIKRQITDIVFEKAFSAEEAIEKFIVFKPNIILLDIGLGRSSGLDVLRHVRKHDQKTKVIIVSNFTDTLFRLRCDDLGANHFIDKSKEFEKIPSLILSIIEKKSVPDKKKN